MTDAGRRQTVALIVSWTIVGIPLIWGVLQVFRKSLDLFR
jgi:hypothetical protein